VLKKLVVSHPAFHSKIFFGNNDFSHLSQRPHAWDIEIFAM